MIFPQLLSLALLHIRSKVSLILCEGMQLGNLSNCGFRADQALAFPVSKADHFSQDYGLTMDSRSHLHCLVPRVYRK